MSTPGGVIRTGYTLVLTHSGQGGAEITAGWLTVTLTVSREKKRSQDVFGWDLMSGVRACARPCRALQEALRGL
jgi:hypothetical protein